MTNEKGFSLVEILLAAALLSVAALVAVAHMTQAAGHADWTRDRVFARQKALSIIAEMRTYVSGLGGATASDLDTFDDGVTVHPTLSIARTPSDPDSFIEPDHLLSGNEMESGQWRWYRRISVMPLQGQNRNDLRECTVRIYRMRPSDVPPGEMMAQVSTIIRTIGEAYAASQVFDLYLIAIENVPAWWVTMDAMRPFVDASLQELQSRNPGLKFRTHWITTLGYGRDEEYAPYTNMTRDSTARTPWTYVYPGSLPTTQLNRNYYVPEGMRARVNLDGEDAPVFQNEFAPREPYTDSNDNGKRDAGEPFVDFDKDGTWDEGNENPYAFADQHNHCMRHPEALARFEARVQKGQDDEQAPSLRLLLDQMSLNPEAFTNAILLNLHGELMPFPATRNYSDAAKDPETHPGWRVVTHSERVLSRRVAGMDAGSDAPRFRVHAYKTEFPTGHAPLMTQAEPYVDANSNGSFDDGEAFTDWNGDGLRNEGTPITIVIPGGDFSAAPNAPGNASLLIERLPGGVDADGDGSPESYQTLHAAPVYPEAFQDGNSDGIRQVQEAFLDLDGDGMRDGSEPHQELDGDGAYTAATESLIDQNGNGRLDRARPAEALTDTNGNGRWDPAEPYWDRNKNGVRDGPTVALPPAWQPWNSTDYGNTTAEDAYVANYGEPFLDLDGDQTWDAAEAFVDGNGNGVHDGGFVRGEMWCSVRYDAWPGRTVLELHGTPLEAPVVGSQGLGSAWRLYDLDYVPCPTPAVNAPGGDRFARDLATSGDVPKNTARWRVTLPLPAVRTAFETAGGAGDGDAQDRVIALETRIGADLDTGTMWPSWYYPQNRSTAYTWFHASASTIPFSERYQMRGDPRHCPYEDTDRYGTTAAHGYNWFWDDFRNGSDDAQGAWLAFDTDRMRQGWMGRSDHDVARMMSWLRAAVVRSEAFFTTISGWSFYYLSVGGDVGSDASNDHPQSIPMDGLPFGMSGDVFENTLISSPGTKSISGSRKFVRTNAGSNASVRSGGYWWSKPFLGELFPDGAYASQWKLSGNLTAAASGSGTGHRLIRRSDVTSNQVPYGTLMNPSEARTASEGCTSFFNVGTSSKTFHHQAQSGKEGSLVEGGFELAANYAYPVPSTVPISRPFSVASKGDGGLPPEFDYTDAYPRHSAALVRRFYDHEKADVGSGLVRLRAPSGEGGFVTVNGLDKATENGSAFLGRYCVLALVQSYFEAGLPGQPNRVPQLPRLEIAYPTISDELKNPSTIPLRWKTAWTRWDEKKYTDAYPADHSEDLNDLFYVLLYSRDGGDSWLHIVDDSKAEPGVPPWIEGVGPDPLKTKADLDPAADETYAWAVPSSSFPEGSYLIRIEAHRKSVRRHYSFHMEKIHVSR